MSANRHLGQGADRQLTGSSKVLNELVIGLEEVGNLEALYSRLMIGVRSFCVYLSRVPEYVLGLLLLVRALSFPPTMLDGVIGDSTTVGMMQMDRDITGYTVKRR